jgi:hypothetical protein
MSNPGDNRHVLNKNTTILQLIHLQGRKANAMTMQGLKQGKGINTIVHSSASK